MENEHSIFLKHLENILTLIKSSGIEIQTVNSQDYFTILKNLLILFLSKYKVVDFSVDNDLIKTIEVINSCLKMLNSKYLLVEKYNIKNFCFVFVYFIIEFDIINDYLEHLYKKFKKLNLIKFDFLFNIIEQLLEKDEKKNNCYNLLSLYNSINFNLKNIKKQVDAFINLSYKLNKLSSSPEMIKYTKTTLKIEEFILFHDRIFDKYLSLTERNAEKFEEYFNILEKIIQKLPKLIDMSIKSFSDNLSLEDNEINLDYVIDSKNFEIKKIRKIFSSFLKFDQSYLTTFEQWTTQLQEKLNLRLVTLKEKQGSVINSSEMKDFLTNFAGKLEEYFEENINNLSDFGFSYEIFNKTKKFIENYQKNLNDDYLGFDKFYEHINKKYEFLSSTFEQLNKIVIEKLKLSYDIYNT